MTKKITQNISLASSIIAILIVIISVVRNNMTVEFDVEQLKKENIELIKELDSIKKDIKSSDIGVIKNEIKHINDELKRLSDNDKITTDKLTAIYNLILNKLK